MELNVLAVQHAPLATLTTFDQTEVNRTRQHSNGADTIRIWLIVCISQTRMDGKVAWPTAKSFCRRQSYFADGKTPKRFASTGSRCRKLLRRLGNDFAVGSVISPTAKRQPNPGMRLRRRRSRFADGEKPLPSRLWPAKRGKRWRGGNFVMDNRRRRN